MSDDTWIARWLWPLLASIAGAITAQSFQPWQTLSKGQIALGIFVGTTFAFFVAPMVFTSFTSSRVAGGVFYLMASGSNILIPMAIKKLALNVGYTEKP